MIGIIGAMKEEVSELIREMKEAETSEEAGMKFCSGLLSGKAAVIVISGIGKVNAAACTQILIDRFKPDCIINTGIAGALDPGLSIGDIVLSSDAVQHDVDVTHFGYKPGQVPQMKVLAFPADKKLIDTAKEAVSETEPDIGVMTGRVASGDCFVADTETKDRIRKAFGAACCEMEGASIAQVSYINRIPFLIIRAMSDKADGTSPLIYAAFEKNASSHFVKLMLAMVRKLD